MAITHPAAADTIGPNGARRDLALAAAIFLPLAALQLALIAGHDPWSDELQALVLARETHDLDSLRDNFRTEGHPPLWHLLLKATLALWDDVGALKLAQAIVALSALALLMFRAPFPLVTRVLIGCGYFVLVEHGMFARSYGLGMLLLFAYAALRERQWRFLPLALLPAVATPFFVFSAGLVAVEVWRGRENIDRALILGLGGWAVIAALALPFMLPDRGMTGGIGERFLADGMVLRAQRTLFGFWATAAPLNPPNFPLVWEMRLDIGPLAWAGGLAPAAIALVAFRRSPYLVPILLLLGFLAAMSFFVHLMAARHLGLVPLALVACEWLRRRPGEDAHPAVRLWLVALAASGLVAAYFHLRVPFTPARAMIAWIEEQKLERANFVSFPDYLFALDISAWLRRPAVGLTSGCAGLFARWGYDHLVLPKRADAVRVLRETAAASGGVAYFIVEPENLKLFAPIAELGLTEIARFETGMIYNRVILRIDAPAANPAPGPRLCDAADR